MVFKKAWFWFIVLIILIVVFFVLRASHQIESKPIPVQQRLAINSAPVIHNKISNQTPAQQTASTEAQTLQVNNAGH